MCQSGPPAMPRDARSVSATRGSPWRTAPPLGSGSPGTVATSVLLDLTDYSPRISLSKRATGEYSPFSGRSSGTRPPIGSLGSSPELLFPRCIEHSLFLVLRRLAGGVLLRLLRSPPFVAYRAVRRATNATRGPGSDVLPASHA